VTLADLPLVNRTEKSAEEIDEIYETFGHLLREGPIKVR